MRFLILFISLIPLCFKPLFASDSLIAKLYTFEEAVTLDVSSAFDEVFVVDKGQSKLYKFNSKGKLEKEIGGYGIGKYAFNELSDVSASYGVHVFVADAGNQRIVQYDRWLNYITSLENLPVLQERESSFKLKDGISQQKWHPISLTISPDGELYVLESTTRQIIRLNPYNFPKSSSGWKNILTFGGYDAGLGALQLPHKVKFSDLRIVFVSDEKRHKIMVYDQFGNFIKALAQKGLKTPEDLAVFSLNALFPGAGVLGAQCLGVVAEESIFFFEIRKSLALAEVATLSQAHLKEKLGLDQDIRAIGFIKQGVLILTENALYKIDLALFQSWLNEENR